MGGPPDLQGRRRRHRQVQRRRGAVQPAVEHVPDRPARDRARQQGAHRPDHPGGQLHARPDHHLRQLQGVRGQGPRHGAALRLPAGGARAPDQRDRVGHARPRRPARRPDRRPRRLRPGRRSTWSSSTGCSACWPCSSSLIEGVHPLVASSASSAPSAGLALTLAGITGIIVSIGVSLDSNVVYYEHLQGRRPRRSHRPGRGRQVVRLRVEHHPRRRRGVDHRCRRCSTSSPSARCGASPSSSGSPPSSTSSRRTSSCARSSGGPPTRSGAPSIPDQFGLPDRSRRGVTVVTGRPNGRRREDQLMSAIVRLYRGENDINFVKWWRRGLILSAVLIVISVASLFTRGLNLGIDFEGGVSWEVKAPGVTRRGGPLRARRRRARARPRSRSSAPRPSGCRARADVRRQAGRGPPGARRPGRDRHRRGQRQHGRARRGARRSPSRPTAPSSSSSSSSCSYLSLRLEWKMAVGAVRGPGPRRPHQRRRVLDLPARGHARRRSSRS